MDIGSLLSEIGVGILGLDWKCLVMFIIGGLLIYLAIAKDYEPMLLLPIGFGAILINIPSSSAFGIVSAGKFVEAGTTVETMDASGKIMEVVSQAETMVDGVSGSLIDVFEPGFLSILYEAGIKTELFPVLIFIAVGAMIDFKPLLQNPFMLFFGAAAQFGIFITMMLALLLGFDLQAAASIGIIGAADGPTSIFVAGIFAPELLGAISVAAYSYMSMVPLIQPPVIKALTTKKERRIRMKYAEVQIPKIIEILFPIMITLVAGIIAPISVALIGALMFGNLVRVCGVLERLSLAAQNELANIVTLLLGITIGFAMRAEEFITLETLMIMGMGLFAFIFDTAGGVLFAKLINVFLPEGKKVNPMIGAAGISAFPMSGRVVQRIAHKEDPTNFILMQAMSANVSGQLGSVVAGSMLLAIVPVIILM